MRYPVNYISITQDWHYGKCLDFGWNALHGGSKVAIYNPADGVVRYAKNLTASGNTLVIEHTDGKCSLFAHLSKITVKVGDKVKIGQQVGNMGATGTDCGGAHLHYGLYASFDKVFKNKAQTQIYTSTIDPYKYLEVYSNQTVGSGTQKKYGSKIKKHIDEKVVTAKPCLRVRNKPSVLGKQIGVVNYNEKVKVYETKNSWSKISEKEEKWVSSGYLK